MCFLFLSVISTTSREGREIVRRERERVCWNFMLAEKHKEFLEGFAASHSKERCWIDLYKRETEKKRQERCCFCLQRRGWATLFRFRKEPMLPRGKTEKGKGC